MKRDKSWEYLAGQAASMLGEVGLTFWVDDFSPELVKNRNVKKLKLGGYWGRSSGNTREGV